jgi:hypothetical protein
MIEAYSTAAVRAPEPPVRAYSAASAVGHGMIEMNKRNTSVRSRKRRLIRSTALIIPWCSIQSSPIVAKLTR